MSEQATRPLPGPRLVAEDEGIYTAAAAELPLLRYYANSIAHLR